MGVSHDKQHPTSDALIQVIGAATVDNLTKLINKFMSAGTESGDHVTDGGSETVDIAAQKILIRSTNARDGELFSLDYAGVSSIAIPANSVRYVGIKYNAGTPIHDVRSADNWNENDEFALASVVNEGGTLHIMCNPQIASDGIGRLLHRLEDTRPLERANKVGGLKFAETGTRNLTLSAGELYARANELPITAKDTSAADRFDTYHGYTSTWTKTATQSQWDNLNYDDGSVTLAALGVSKWANLFLYIEGDDNFAIVYGRAAHNTLADALDEAIPDNLPDRLAVHAVYAGRLVFQQNAATAEEILTAFDDTAVASASVPHNNLSLLQGGTSGEMYHFTSAQHGALSVFDSVSEEAAPGDDFRFLGQQETDDAYKFVQAQNLPGGVGGNGVTLNSKDITDNTIGNTTSKTTLFGPTLAGGVLSTNNAVCLRCFGWVDNNSGGANAFTFYLDYGGTEISVSKTVSAGEKAHFMVEAYVTADSATNAQDMALLVRAQDEADSGDADTDIITGEATVDSTASQTCRIRGKWTASPAVNPSAKMYFGSRVKYE
jgi:hypothetical protein